MRSGFLCFGFLAAAQLSAPAVAEGPVAVELFTSQSCSSCPPAEAFLREIAKRPGVVALEWHVDYWDDLRAGAAGKWKDPFSSPGHTARQRAYNAALRGTRAVYTPQTVVMGAAETVGSRRKAVSMLIDKAEKSGSSGVSIAAAGAPGGGTRFAVTGAPESAEATLVMFRKSAETRVKGGENSGSDLASAHVVTAFRAAEIAQDRTVAAPAPKSGEGCALLVAAPGGAILAASYCSLDGS